MTTAERLISRWPLDHAEETRDALLTAYGAPTRGYHDLRHLAEVLDRLDELTDACVHFDQAPVALAAWFHDAVYDGTPGDEERSAEWAHLALAEVGIADKVVTEVARLVRLTATHDPLPEDHNGAALCDADLAILAAPPERYAEYAADVRREYAHVPEPDFRSGRAAVLNTLLEADRLFRTPYGARHWEARARANVTAEIAQLTG